MMIWGSKPQPGHRGIWRLTKNGYEVGTFSVIDDLFQPESVVAAIVAILQNDEDTGQF